MPPPATPMFPISNWRTASARTFWVPTVCWVMPMAYMTVATLSGLWVDVNSSATLRKVSFGQPVMAATFSGV